jgi:hypothetical protein
MHETERLARILHDAYVEFRSRNPTEFKGETTWSAFEDLPPLSRSVYTHAAAKLIQDRRIQEGDQGEGLAELFIELRAMRRYLEALDPRVRGIESLLENLPVSIDADVPLALAEVD